MADLLVLLWVVVDCVEEEGVFVVYSKEVQVEISVLVMEVEVVEATVVEGEAALD